MATKIKLNCSSICAITISQEIIKCSNFIDAFVRAALKGLEIIEDAYHAGQLLIPEMEISWIDMLSQSLSEIPTDVSKLIEEMLPMCEGKFIPKE